MKQEAKHSPSSHTPYAGEHNTAFTWWSVSLFVILGAIMIAQTILVYVCLQPGSSVWWLALIVGGSGTLLALLGGYALLRRLSRSHQIFSGPLQMSWYNNSMRL